LNHVSDKEIDDFFNALSDSPIDYTHYYLRIIALRDSGESILLFGDLILTIKEIQPNASLEMPDSDSLVVVNEVHKLDLDTLKQSLAQGMISTSKGIIKLDENNGRTKAWKKIDWADFPSRLPFSMGYSGNAMRYVSTDIYSIFTRYDTNKKELLKSGTVKFYSSLQQLGSMTIGRHDLDDGIKARLNVFAPFYSTITDVNQEGYSIEVSYQIPRPLQDGTHLDVIIANDNLRLEESKSVSSELDEYQKMVVSFSIPVTMELPNQIECAVWDTEKKVRLDRETKDLVQPRDGWKWIDTHFNALEFLPAFLEERFGQRYVGHPQTASNLFPDAFKGDYRSWVGIWPPYQLSIVIAQRAGFPTRIYYKTREKKTEKTMQKIKDQLSLKRSLWLYRLLLDSNVDRTKVSRLDNARILYRFLFSLATVFFSIGGILYFNIPAYIGYVIYLGLGAPILLFSIVYYLCQRAGSIDGRFYTDITFKGCTILLLIVTGLQVIYENWDVTFPFPYLLILVFVGINTLTLLLRTKIDKFLRNEFVKIRQPQPPDNLFLEFSLKHIRNLFLMTMALVSTMILFWSTLSIEYALFFSTMTMILVIVYLWRERKGTEQTLLERMKDIHLVVVLVNNQQVRTTIRPL